VAVEAHAHGRRRDRQIALIRENNASITTSIPVVRTAEHAQAFEREADATGPRWSARSSGTTPSMSTTSLLPSSRMQPGVG
jgi:hypothetical protein